MVHTGQQPQQGGLAGAVGPEHGHVLAGADVEAVDPQDLAPVTDLAHLPQAQRRAHAAPDAAPRPVGR